MPNSAGDEGGSLERSGRVSPALHSECEVFLELL